LFLTWGLRYAATGERVVGREARAVSIALGKEAGKLVTATLKKPHDLEYEKTFDPYLQLAPKRYAGMMYEDDPDAVPKLKSMGIVLKRRDNAPIVKDLYGGVLAILMANGKVSVAVDFIRRELECLVTGGVPMSRLVITKSLSSRYQNPLHHAHKVLADRIANRDPGNAPRPGDRVKFVYVVAPGAKLQGDRVESPEFITQRRLAIDYSYYVTNQIMKPLLQVFALVLDSVPGYNRLRGRHMIEEGKLQSSTDDDVQLERRKDTLRRRYVKDLVFGEALREAKNRTTNQRDLHSFFGASPAVL
jgi:DNA polymerase elongation subunit (family B)